LPHPETRFDHLVEAFFQVFFPFYTLNNLTDLLHALFATDF
jgi:hypothetical protein